MNPNDKSVRCQLLSSCGPTYQYIMNSRTLQKTLRLLIPPPLSRRSSSHSRAPVRSPWPAPLNRRFPGDPDIKLNNFTLCHSNETIFPIAIRKNLKNLNIYRQIGMLWNNSTCTDLSLAGRRRWWRTWGRSFYTFPPAPSRPRN